MPRLRWFLSAAVAVALLAGLATRTAADDPPEGFVKLFNGKDTAGWKAHNGKTEAWKVADGVLHVNGGGGWLMTEKEYGDFELRLNPCSPR